MLAKSPHGSIYIFGKVVPTSPHVAGTAMGPLDIINLHDLAAQMFNHGRQLDTGPPRSPPAGHRRCRRPECPVLLGRVRRGVRGAGGGLLSLEAEPAG